MKYGNDNVVDAIYSGEKKGNPFLEAMPEMRVYPELCVNSKLAQNRARIILGRKTAVRDSALAAS